MIEIKDIVNDTYTNTSGYCLYLEMKKYFLKNIPFDLSFRDITSTSSSFLNSSFGNLIEEFGLEKFTSLVRLKNVSVGEAAIIKKYVSGFKSSHQKS